MKRFWKYGDAPENATGENITVKMWEFSREKALFRKVGTKNPLTNRYPRVLNRVVEPYHTPRDRSLRGKARIKARKVSRA